MGGQSLQSSVIVDPQLFGHKQNIMYNNDVYTDL